MKNIFMGLVLTCLGACSTSVEKYELAKPNLNLREFFNGKLIAHGYFKDRFNVVKKSFVVTMNAQWVNDECTIVEDFVYSDGTKSNRIWKLKEGHNNEISGTANDVIGVAKGKIAGNALYWVYDIKLDSFQVTFDDWMFLIDQKTLINQSYVSKFGINVGEVVLSIRKE